MAEKRPAVWRNLLIVSLAVFVLIAVASVSFKLGVRHAGSLNPAMARFERSEIYRGQFGSRGMPGFGAFAGGGSDEDGTRGFMFGMGTQSGFGRVHMGGMYGARLAMLLIGATLVGMLVLGTIAFFRTGGWRPAPANATQPSRRKRS